MLATHASMDLQELCGLRCVRAAPTWRRAARSVGKLAICSCYRAASRNTVSRMALVRGHRGCSASVRSVHGPASAAHRGRRSPHRRVVPPASGVTAELLHRRRHAVAMRSSRTAIDRSAVTERPIPGVVRNDQSRDVVIAPWADSNKESRHMEN